MHIAALSAAIRRGPRAAVQYLREIHLCSKSDAGLHLPCVRLDELISETIQVTVYRPASRDDCYASLILAEINALCSLVVARQPKKILEIGTYRGLTTLNLAMNAPQAIVHTLDETRRWGPLIYEGRPETVRIREHLVNSRIFDFQEGGPQVDLCLIDAGHSYDLIRNDTAKALPLLSEDSLLLWHDYAGNHSLIDDKVFGVPKFLHEIADVGVQVLKGTSFALLFVNPEVRKQLNEKLC